GAARGDFLFLHGLEERRLRLGRRAVDFVGQDHVAKNRSVDETEGAFARGGVLFQDFGAGDVGRHQVRGELDTRELEVERLRHGRNEQRLGQTGNAHQQAVTASEQSDQELFHHGVLAHDHLADFGAEGVAGLVELADIVHGGRAVGLGHCRNPFREKRTLTNEPGRRTLLYTPPHYETPGQGFRALLYHVILPDMIGRKLLHYDVVES